MPGRVAVIGAGSSGLTAVKNLAEAGFQDIVCYERRDVLGGLWHYTEQARWEDESCVNRSTVINTSKEFMAFSDYPMPETDPNFCHNENVEAYFKDYARHFGVEKYIRYNTEVMSLKQDSTYSSTGRWQLVVLDHQSGKETQEIFDFVLVANGHHGKPQMPKFPGMDKFKGQVLHSKEFKDTRLLPSKRAVVVGIGNSGGDISVEISKYARVFLCTRRGAWILNRLTASGMPWDFTFHTRSKQLMNSLLPAWYIMGKVKAQLNQRFDHDLYAMTPDFYPNATHPTANDEIGNRIAAGMIKVKPNIREFTENGIVFEDGTFEDNIDLVVLATGYKIYYPFIDKKVVDIKDNRVFMYKNMFPVHLSKHSIAFLGLIQPLGAIFPISEMQSRLAARVFKGEVELPSEEEMARDTKRRLEQMARRYVATARHTIQVDWLPFMDELALLTGCKPNLYKLLFTDPRLWYHVLFGPGVPYQYRLHGPNAWPGARQAIMTVMDRIRKPFQTREIPTKRRRSWNWTISTSILVVVAVAGATYYVRENNLDPVHYVSGRLFK